MCHPILLQEKTCCPAAGSVISGSLQLSNCSGVDSASKKLLDQSHDFLRAAETQWLIEVEIWRPMTDQHRTTLKDYLTPELPIRLTLGPHQAILLPLPNLASFLFFPQSFQGQSLIDILHTIFYLQVSSLRTKTVARKKIFPMGRASSGHLLCIERNGPS